MALRPTGDEFESWSKRAAEARDRLLAAWKAECEEAEKTKREPAFDPAIDDESYKGIRPCFFGWLYYKCAYCEVNHSDGYPVQVEHYRPKKGATEERRAITHVGYFWLAYEWWYLMRSCASCTTNPLRGETHPGKKNEFPVGSTRIPGPSDNPGRWMNELASEDALLLNPYFDEPAEHIDFEPLTGAAMGLIARRKKTIETCDLPRPSLNEKQRELRLHTEMDCCLD